MHYRNQLVLTGQINDVGAYTRTNIPTSYRMGIELQSTVQPLKPLLISVSVALSRNKINDFTEYVDDYDNGGQKSFTYSNPDIAFSPSFVGNATISYKPVAAAELSLFSKYVSRQYLDNTSNKERQLKEYFVNDLRASYTFRGSWFKEISVLAQVNNVFNIKYEPNGWTYSYLYDNAVVADNYYYPMAGANFMAGLNIKF